MKKTIPTILTTSHKLSTGVDARNIRNIVLMRPIKSMIEFKQIVGRGTRLFDGKDYFTIYDFVKAYEHFNDPEWDGDPEPCPVCGELACICDIEKPQVCNICGQQPCVCAKPACPRCGYHPCRCGNNPCAICGKKPCVCRQINKVKIRLADGKERTIQHMMATTFCGSDGMPVSAEEFVRGFYGELPALFSDENQLREIWSNPDTRSKLLQGLKEKGYGKEQLAEISKIIDAEKSDLYDVLSYIAFASATLTRAERALVCQEKTATRYANVQQEFLDSVLRHYVTEGVTELAAEKLEYLLKLKYRALADAIKKLGNEASIKEMFFGFQQYLYAKETATQTS